MRILHVSQPTEAGVALVVRQLAADQVRRGHAVSVACPASGRLPSEIRAEGAAWVRWEARRSPGPSVLAETMRLRRIIRALRPDVIHLHSAKAGLGGRLAVRNRTATVFEPHAWSFFVGGTVGAASLRWERLAARWCDAIVCVSEGEREVGERTGIRGRFVVIPNGVDVEALKNATDRDRRRARARLDIADGPLVVCVGRLSRQKGQDVLLAAWPRVIASTGAARLVLVGDGPEHEALSRRRTAGVELVGHRDDVPDWLAAADVVALPSRWEGMSEVMLQAMASGRSVVATDVPGTREALGAGAGAIVRVEDAEGLASALVQRLLDPGLAAAEGAAARRVVVERYDVRRVAEQTARLYEDVLAARSKRARS